MSWYQAGYHRAKFEMLLEANQRRQHNETVTAEESSQALPANGVDITQ